MPATWAAPGARNLFDRAAILRRDGEGLASDKERDLSQYYAEQRTVEAIILLKVDTAQADDIANKLASFPQIQHAYLVTGEDDIILKAAFRTYRELKDFIIKSLAPLPGLEDTKTMMVVTTYKEGGQKVE